MVCLSALRSRLDASTAAPQRPRHQGSHASRSAKPALLSFLRAGCERVSTGAMSRTLVAGTGAAKRRIRGGPIARKTHPTSHDHVKRPLRHAHHQPWGRQQRDPDLKLYKPTKRGQPSRQAKLHRHISEAKPASKTLNVMQKTKIAHHQISKPSAQASAIKAAGARHPGWLDAQHDSATGHRLGTHNQPAHRQEAKTRTLKLLERNSRSASPSPRGNAKNQSTRLSPTQTGHFTRQR